MKSNQKKRVPGNKVKSKVQPKTMELFPKKEKRETLKKTK
jgi:hypothetical protein